MPPKTSDETMYAVGWDRLDGALSSAADASYKVFYPKGESMTPYLDLQHPGLADNNKTAELCASFTKTLSDLTQRATQLETIAVDNRHGGTALSPVLDACLKSLQTRMPLVLNQAALLIQSLQSSQDESTTMVAKLRSSFAVVRATQYLDLIEAGIQNPPRDALDEQLSKVLQCTAVEQLPSDVRKDLCFRISPWITTALAFDLPVGNTAVRTLTGGKSLPLTIEIEPVVEFSATDLLNEHRRESIFGSFGSCEVDILECKHSPRAFSSGAGTIGECMVRVRVSPINDENNNRLGVWGFENEVKKLCVSEARAVQINAYPPKPKANVDLYTSYVYGDSSVTVTLIIKTCVTANGEPPKIHTELFIAKDSSTKC